MGSHLSKIQQQNGVNYDCPVCKKTNRPPNLAGKFVLINDYQYKCSGCSTLFNKNTIFSFYSDKKPIIIDSFAKV
jgi:hypothetical protein